MALYDHSFYGHFVPLTFVKGMVIIMKLAGVLLAVAMLLGANPDAPEVIRDRMEDSVILSFAGDCTLGAQKGAKSKGNFNWYADNEEPDYFLKNVYDIFSTDDFTIVNCEGVLTDRPLEYYDKGSDGAFYFKGKADNAKIFTAGSVEIASVINNHTRDYGPAGKSDTIDALEAEGVRALDANKPVYVEKDGIRISFLACGIWYTGQEKDIYKSLDEMNENSDIQVIYSHGGTEGVYEVDSWRKSVYHSLINRGVDIIVNSHPHRLQPVEHYKNGLIVYSLGDFCFGGNSFPVNKKTAIYRVKITRTDDGFEFEDEIIPCWLHSGTTSANNFQPTPVDPVEYADTYEKMIAYMRGERKTID